MIKNIKLDPINFLQIEIGKCYKEDNSYHRVKGYDHEQDIFICESICVFPYGIHFYDDLGTFLERVIPISDEVFEQLKETYQKFYVNINEITKQYE
jgi:hypothetical protein